jgi:type VI secretion system protein ImpK
VEQTIGVFGEQLLLWVCLLRQSPQRPPPEHVHRQANLLFDELKGSKEALGLPVESVDDGMFAIAALLDEYAMTLPDLRPLWATHPIQATRWMTNNAGVEVYTRLERVRQGPKSVFATYITIFGLGFQGRYGLPGQSQDQLANLRRQIQIEMGIDTDRDWAAGVLKATRQELAAEFAPKEPWYRSLWMGRGLSILVLFVAIITLTVVLARNLG